MLPGLTIRVENFQGSILLLSGERDQLWPGAEMGRQIMQRLDAHAFGWPHEHLVFDGGHNAIVMNRNGWRKIFTFLDEHIA